MRIFAQEPQAPQHAVFPKPAIFGRARFEQSDGVNSMLHLQRTIGNQAVQRLLEANAEEFAASSAGTASTPLGHASAARSLQTKLTINKPGNEYEQEADRVTERVMGMPASQRHGAPVTHDAGRDEHLPSNAIARAITPIAQAAGTESATVSDEVTDQIASTRVGGSPLPESSRNFMESRFGADFSQVRIHTGDYAAQLSKDLNAKAFTVGSDIYFNENFSPESSEGRSLLAHELTHTVQQGAVSSSPAAQLMIQKADGDKDTTHFGEFEAVKYHELKQKSDGKEVGVEMFMKFNPGPNVDAKLIGMTQAARGKIGGTCAATPGSMYERRSATAGAGQGEFIDRLAGFPNPLYPTGDKPTGGADASKLTSYPTVASTALSAAQVTATEAATGQTGRTRTGWGKHGFRYMDAGALKGPESAELYDAPQLGTAGTANDSEQIFESAALAIDGTQKDTYYGSVTWGWKRDTAGKFSMIPFKALSQGTPTVNFLTAASVWNTATEDFNWGVNAATADVLDPTDLSKKNATIAKGTALTWGGAQGTVGGVTYNLVTVKDGASAGTSGAINSTAMAKMDVGRATVKLPITEVQTVNTAGAWMVSDPAKAAATTILKLPKGTRVTIVPAAIVQAMAAVAGVKLDPDWTFIKIVDGPDVEKTGFVKTTMLTREALGAH